MTGYLFIGGPYDGKRIELEEAHLVHRLLMPLRPVERYIDFNLSENITYQTVTYRRVTVKKGDWWWYEYVFSSKSGGVEI